MPKDLAKLSLLNYQLGKENALAVKKIMFSIEKTMLLVSLHSIYVIL
jgi:hypothetical protein